jgi:hypothetical protein
MAALVATAGAIMTLLGAGVVEGEIAQLPPLDRFVQFNLGMFDMNVCRFLGFAGSALLYALAAIVDDGDAAPRPGHALGRVVTGAAVVELGIAGVAFAAGAPGAALVAVAAAFMLAVGRLLPDTETAPRALAARWLATWMLATMMLGRGAAREAAVWRPELTHADRVRELLSLARERGLAIGLDSLALVIYTATTIALLARGGRAWRPRGVAWACLALVAVSIAADVTTHARFTLGRDALRRDLDAQFRRYARIDPPASDQLGDPRFAPHRAPGLQLGRDVVAVNGMGVARTSSPDLALHLGADLSHVLAGAVADPERAPLDPDLSLTVDRAVPYRDLLAVLAIAARAGARTVELLYARGPAVDLPHQAPPETGYMLPSDFMALRVEVSPGGYAPDPGAPFGTIAPELVRRALATPSPVQLAPPAEPASSTTR